MFISLGTAAPQWRAGKVRLLAIGAPHRLPDLPDIPTIGESGVPGFEAASWFALYGPANMPAEVVGKINGEVRALFGDAEFRKTFMAPQFFESIADTPEKLSEYLRSETAKWSRVIRDANIKVE
jgi:tripartite-type tricarboxylate transporter receptor subunit TctC